MNVHIAVVAILILILGYIGFLIFQPFAPFIMGAALLAFMLYPLHQRLAPYIGERPSAFILVVFTIAATLAPLAVVGYLVMQALEDAARGIDQVVLVTQVEELLESFTSVEIDLIAEIEEVLERIAEAALGEIAAFVATTIHFMFGVMLLVFLLYYLLLDGRTFMAWLTDVTPIDDPVQAELVTEANVITWAVLKSHLFVAIIQGVLTGIGFYIAGVPNPAFWTSVMILLAILPVVGVSIVWAPAVVYLLYIGSFPSAIFLFAYGGIVINLDNYFRAILVDRESELHPAVVLVGVVGGLFVFGVLGLFIGPIVLAILKATINVFGRTYAPELVSSG